MIAEGVIGAVLGLGLLALLTWPARGPVIVLAAQGFALLGTLVGAFTIAVAVGPQTRGDAVFHVVLLVVLLAGIHAAWRWRRLPPLLLSGSPEAISALPPTERMAVLVDNVQIHRQIRKGNDHGSRKA